MRLARAKRVFYFMKRELWLHIGLYLFGRGDLRSPAISVTAARSSVAQKRDLQKPSPVEKVPRNEADEVKINKI